MKRLRIFAGPNGSGKSTLFRNFPTNLQTGVFLNADEIEKALTEKGFINLSDLNLVCTSKAFNKFLKSSTLKSKAEKSGFKIDVELKRNVLVNLSKKTNSYEAAIIAAFLREELIKSGRNFSFESVLSHHSKLDEIREAINSSYQTYLYYICTESPIINKERVLDRVEKGGHEVPENKIETRYYNSLELLYEVIKVVHRAYIFDNSGKSYRLIGQFYKGKYSEFYGRYPKWFNKYVIQRMEI